MVQPDLSTEYYKNLLKNSVSVNLEDAVFRDEKVFCIANLKNHLPFWEHEVLKDHPHKLTLLKWIQGVQIEDFLNSFTTGEFQGKTLNSYYPEPRVFENYVPQQFEEFIDTTVKDWVSQSHRFEQSQVCTYISCQKIVEKVLKPRPHDR